MNSVKSNDRKDSLLKEGLPKIYSHLSSKMPNDYKSTAARTTPMSVTFIFDSEKILNQNNN